MSNVYNKTNLMKIIYEFLTTFHDFFMKCNQNMKLKPFFKKKL